MNLSELKKGDVLYIGKRGDWFKDVVKEVKEKTLLTKNDFEVIRGNLTTYTGTLDEQWQNVTITTDIDFVIEELSLWQEQITSSFRDLLKPIKE